MRRSPLATAAVLAVVIGLAGCAAPVEAADPTSSPSVASAPSPTPTPTPEALVVGPAELPPQVFGGDCAAAIDPAALTTASGYTIEEVVPRDTQWANGLLSAGGLTCEWDGGRIDILPRPGLGDAELSAATHEYYYVDCDWMCSWVWETDSLWISGMDWGVDGRTREEVDALGSAIGPHIAARWDAMAEQEWTRDHTGWLPEIGCDAMAAAVGEQLGRALTGAEGSYHDAPGAVVTLTDMASNLSWCGLSAEGRTLASVHVSAGRAWSVPSNPDAAPVDLRIPGIEAYDSAGLGYVQGASYEVTDGVNVILADVVDDDPDWTATQLVAAIAEAAASRFE